MPTLTSETGYPRLGSLVVAIAISMITPSAIMAAEEDQGDAGQSIDQLAEEGYWGEKSDWPKHKAMLGKPMPAIALSQWVDKDKQLTRADMKGKILVIDFWATWCGPCIRAIPHNNELYEKYHEQGVEVIGACGGGGEEKMPAIAKQHKITYPTARTTRDTTNKWKVGWWPTYAVVDRAGKVRAVGIRPDYVEPIVDALVAESPAASEVAGEGARENADAAATTQPVDANADADAGDAAQAAANEPPEHWLEGRPQQRKRLDGMQGEVAPALAVRNWVNTPALKLDALQGKVVLLDFWATWCGPCIRSIPHTNEMAEKYKDQGLVIIGVCHQEGADKMQQVAKAEGIKYPIAADLNGKTVEAYRADSFPDYYLIDRAGNLRVADCNAGALEEAIEALLAEPVPEQDDVAQAE